MRRRIFIEGGILKNEKETTEREGSGGEDEERKEKKGEEKERKGAFLQTPRATKKA